MLTLKPTEIINQRTGDSFDGGIGECECGGHTFIILWVTGQDHPHYQCTECESSYCGTWDGRDCIKPARGN